MTTMTTPKPTRTEPRRESLLSDFTLAPVSDEERHRATLAVCARSRNAAEARSLLEALGLI